MFPNIPCLASLSLQLSKVIPHALMRVFKVCHNSLINAGIVMASVLVSKSYAFTNKLGCNLKSVWAAMKWGQTDWGVSSLSQSTHECGFFCCSRSKPKWETQRCFSSFFKERGFTSWRSHLGQLYNFLLDFVLLVGFTVSGFFVSFCLVASATASVSREVVAR